MKYQIYLNKDATIVVETLAKGAGIKTSRFIKYVLEQFSKEASPKLEQILTEISQARKEQIK